MLAVVMSENVISVHDGQVLGLEEGAEQLPEGGRGVGQGRQ